MAAAGTPNEPVVLVELVLDGGSRVTVSADVAKRVYPGYPRVAPEQAAVEAARPDAARVRAWASANDVDCPASGRVPKRVYEAFEQAHK